MPHVRSSWLEFSKTVVIFQFRTPKFVDLQNFMKK